MKFHVFCQPSLLWTENKLVYTPFTNVPLHSIPQASTSTALMTRKLVLDAIPSSPHPFLKICIDMRQLKIILLVWIYFIVLNWHYHIHPILNGQQNKTTDEIKLQQIIDYIMKATSPHALYCTFSSLAWWKLSLEELLKKAFTDVFTWLHYYFYVNSATFQITVYLGCFLLHPFC